MKVVFVHIGKNPSPTLFKAAEVARQSLPEAEICLISDQKSLLESFTGTRIHLNTDLVHSFLNPFIKKNRELKNIAGGYWLNTISRLFALLQAAQVNPDESLIHLESDVYLYATNIELSKFPFSKDAVSYPRLSPSRGIASFLHSPNLKALESFLSNLSQILSEKSELGNDMDLLGYGLNLGVATELPSAPAEDEDSSNPNFIFDGAAIGQYLFGIDPIHTAGQVISGFQNPDYTLALSNLKWSIPESGKLKVTHHDKQYEILSLHAHSKELIGLPDSNNPRWQQIISEANMELPRVVTERSFENILLEKPSLIDRVRIARKNGIIKYLGASVLRRARNTSNKLR